MIAQKIDLTTKYCKDPMQYSRLISYTPSVNKPGRTAPDKIYGSLRLAHSSPNTIPVVSNYRRCKAGFIIIHFLKTHSS